MKINRRKASLKGYYLTAKDGMIYRADGHLHKVFSLKDAQGVLNHLELHTRLLTVEAIRAHEGYPQPTLPRGIWDEEQVNLNGYGDAATVSYGCILLRAAELAKLLEDLNAINLEPLLPVVALKEGSGYYLTVTKDNVVQLVSCDGLETYEEVTTIADGEAYLAHLEWISQLKDPKLPVVRYTGKLPEFSGIGKGAVFQVACQYLDVEQLRTLVAELKKIAPPVPQPEVFNNPGTGPVIGKENL